MASDPIAIQPYMFVRHPAYRAQLDVLSSLAPQVRVHPVFPEDVVELERWAPRRSAIARAIGVLGRGARNLSILRRGIAGHYFVGAFSPTRHLLPTMRHVYVDADDPVNLYRGVFRNRIRGIHCRSMALRLLSRMERGTLALSFWTETQLRNFAATLRPSESGPLLAAGRLRVLPPAIASAPVAAEIGCAETLRCLTVASAKFWGKGVADAITAVHRAGEEGYAVTLTIVADGVPGHWRSLVAALPCVRLLGRVPRAELDALYRQHDLLVFPSHHDTYGWVVLEAKAHGVPALATDAYTRPEIISHERDGLLVPDPFSNPYLPITPVAYAEGFLEPSRRGVSASPLIKPYLDALTAALVRCCRDREFLRAMGRSAYHSTAPGGRFSMETRRATLRGVLRALVS